MKQKKSELPRKPRVPVHAAPQSHEVRIIGGQWKRTKLAVADKPGLRPTPDRVRETLFNWLGQDLTGWRCIDAFAGTGVLGFEAASRGAKEVTLVEQDTALVVQLKRIQTQLQASATQIVRGDGVAALKQIDPASMDVVFLDPPFDSVLFEAALQAAGRVVALDGFVYLEAPILWTDEQLLPAGLKVHRYLKAGAVHAHLLKRLG
ncbi:MAG: 16S rRNA (guanine(966)-N(2))-methyltransferase RsmD [Rhodoferax sp.]|uniref:16S rRNA (guanine(966)-N(2))-methyltransferase RsmD n=1 Tax=Rhodoferax sp. TaxID=50421 RepID=UPI0017BD0482|nr:16S rRNA (guanine(966)-N(2))-methyltransferase RsmD [Rhodoferax sp.]NMM13519.1 16S rRNA (guanine(966)-N(2))-methyltransferase RsmD [Rhodoferax sp.]NMM20614.1 16S rRNA (guanine(966)-N(2))-methyltransferase RsmD [Rhodoferax sp.]